MHWLTHLQIMVRNEDCILLLAVIMQPSLMSIQLMIPLRLRSKSGFAGQVWF